MGKSIKIPVLAEVEYEHFVETMAKDDKYYVVVDYGKEPWEVDKETYAMVNEWVAEEVARKDVRPCPFCGGKAQPVKVEYPYSYWDVQCENMCVEHFCEAITMERAIDRWNKRAE